MISQATIDKVKELAALEVLSTYIKFNSANKACCPFHDEKTPSLSVKKGESVWKCFGCGVSGAPIDFVMKHQNITFPEAVEEIANKFGIQVIKENVNPQAEAERLTREQEASKILNWAHTQYQKALANLPTDHPAYEYIHNRFTPEEISEWQIGYAPDEWKFLTPQIIAKEHYDMGIELGLIKTKEANGSSNTYDFYRNRIMFPILANKKLIGFAARDLSNEQGVGKWYNPKESFLYNKENTLYAMDIAKQNIKDGVITLMEGYGDVITAHSNGLNNTVASCGTSVTEGQLNLMKRYAHTIALFMDGDEAGQIATEKTILTAMEMGFNTLVVTLNQGQDPEDFFNSFDKNAESTLAIENNLITVK